MRITVQPLSVDAGNDIDARVGGIVELNGSGSSGDDIYYDWHQEEGPDVYLYDYYTLNPSFIADDPSLAGETLVFELTVSGSDGSSSSDTVSVRMVANEPPVVDAGDYRHANAGTTVVLDGSGSSDPDGDRLTYLWEIEDADGEDIVLQNAGTKRATFVAPDGYNYLVFSLTVSDGAYATTDYVVITTSWD